MKIQFVFLPVLLILLTAVIQPGFLLNQEIEVPAEPITGMGNPAAVHCQDLGYKFKTVQGPNGERGICEMPDGEACEAWAFLQGECGQDHSLCAKQGLGIETRSDGKNSFSPKYAVCVDEKGKEIGSVPGLSNLPDKALGCGGEVESAEAPETLTALTADSESLDGVPPGDFDWRSYNGGNWLTPVRNQAQCGSCWAFSAVGVAEAALNIAAENPDLDPNLSEQLLVSDCHDPYNNDYQNCCGGYKSKAIEYIRDAGIPDENCFSYVDGTSSYDGSTCACGSSCGSGCQYSSSGSCSDTTCGDRCGDWDQRLETIEEYGYVGTDPTKIKNALINYGPLSVSLDMGGSWDGDIFRCSNEDGGTNHAVIIVGYDDTGGYWIVRNSWGTGWNGDGYFKVGFNECSIENYVYYATALSNQPPHQPSSPAPASGSTGVDVDQDLSWAGGDPDSGDSVTYDVFFEANDSTPDQLLCENATTTACDPGTLTPGTTYYWQVTAEDNHGYRTDSSVWSVTTQDQSTTSIDGVGYYNGSKNKWILNPSHNKFWNDVLSYSFGPALGHGWVPLTGDWDANESDTAGYYNAEKNKWIIKNSHSDGWGDVQTYTFGPALGHGWTPITGDWDGNGSVTAGYYNAEKNKWILKSSHTDGWGDVHIFIFGPAPGHGWIPITGDWNGDGTDTVGYFNAEKNKWIIKNSLSDGWGDVTDFNFGGQDSSWIPISGQWGF